MDTANENSANRVIRYLEIMFELILNLESVVVKYAIYDGEKNTISVLKNAATDGDRFWQLSDRVYTIC